MRKTHSAAWCAALIACLLPACRKSRTASDWNTPGGSPPPPATTETVATPAPAPEPVRAAEPAPEPESPAPVSSQPAAAPQSAAPSTTGLRFVAYNVENWLVMDRHVVRNGKHENLKNAPKEEQEKRAVVTMLTRHQPDVLGLCEIGTREDLAEVQTLLKAAGLDLPHAHYSGGSDPVRHLGILSRFPITSTASQEKLEYQIAGTTMGMNRGILDATIEARGKSYRFLGVHLKSRREVEDGDQAQMRLQEAHLLRNHVNSILTADPKARLVVYGDFNDEWGTPPIKTIVGVFNTPTYLTAIRLRDRTGIYWTHYWSIRDSYSRIDYIAVSQALRHDTDFSSSRIIDDPEWIDASDHRPVMTVFR